MSERRSQTFTATLVYSFAGRGARRTIPHVPDTLLITRAPNVLRRRLYIGHRRQYSLLGSLFAFCYTCSQTYIFTLLFLSKQPKASSTTSVALFQLFHINPWIQSIRVRIELFWFPLHDLLHLFAKFFPVRVWIRPLVGRPKQQSDKLDQFILVQ